MGTAAGKTVFVIAALLVLAIAVALNVDPKAFVGNERAACLGMAAIAGIGASAYFIGVSTRSIVVAVLLCAAAAVGYEVFGNGGNPLDILSRL